MYEHFYNLSAEPFRLSPDHRFCYNHTLYAKAKAYMAYAFMRAEGFVMITGQPGTGKTTLVGDLVESLANENVTVGKLVSTQLAEDDLLRMVAFAFGIEATEMPKSVLLQQLTVRFSNLYRERCRALLIVDECQDLSHSALEELRLLTNLQEDGHPLLQIFLLGQSEFRDMVHSPALRQVHQRIVAASHLEALQPDETRAYVETRLRAVGWNNDPAISNAVYPVIYKFSEGVPRRINLICSRLFLHCCVEKRHQITLEDARTVVSELQEEQLSTRNLLHDEMFFASDSYESAGAPEGGAEVGVDDFASQPVMGEALESSGDDGPVDDEASEVKLSLVTRDEATDEPPEPLPESAEAPAEEEELEFVVAVAGGGGVSRLESDSGRPAPRVQEPEPVSPPKPRRKRKAKKATARKASKAPAKVQDEAANQDSMASQVEGDDAANAPVPEPAVESRQAGAAGVDANKSDSQQRSVPVSPPSRPNAGIDSGVLAGLFLVAVAVVAAIYVALPPDLL